MANSRDERDTPGEDLFDDLDKFFAPIEETDWPEPGAEAPPPARRGRTAPVASSEPDDDLFPEGWSPSLEPDVDEGLLEAAASPRPDPPAEPPAVPQAEPERAGSQADDDMDDTSAFEFTLPDDDEAKDDAGPAAEGTAEDAVWDDIPPGAGEGEEEESFLFGAEQRPTGPSTGELTIDDLKVAPPEYANLPGPGDERPAPSSIFGDEEATFSTSPPTAPRPSAAAASIPPATGDRSATPVEEPAHAGTFETEPASQATRAADHFAEGMRTSRQDVQDDLLAGLEEAPPVTTAPRTVKVGTDETVMGAGPAWEDPTSHAVVSETGAPGGGGRNLSAALISGVALGALAVILLMIGAGPFAILAGVVLLAAQAELYAVARSRGFQPATALGLVVGALILYAGYNKGEVAMAAMLSLGTVLSFLWYMAAPPKARHGTLMNIAVTVMGLVYVPFFAGFIFGILPAPGGRAIVISVIFLTVLYDVAAFGFGSLWGHRSLAPTISPNKSWEGAIAASLVSLFVALAFGPQIEPFSVASSLGLALVVIVMAPLGDLAESALKRDLGVKDMSTIMPGHGGLMDRIDSLLFVLPAAYLFLRVIFT